MLRVLVIASVLSAVYATNYAYVGNNLIEYEDPPAQSISLPLPYKEPSLTKNAQRVRNNEVYYSEENAVVTNSHTYEEESVFSVDFICNKITVIFNFIKKKIIKIITAIPSFIISIIASIGKCIVTAICNKFDIAKIPSMSDLSILMTPERLKRATEYLDTAIKEINSL